MTFALLGPTACELTPTDNRASSTISRAIGGDIVARVDNDAIPLALVAEVARAQRLPAQEALRRVVDDAIAAKAAIRHGLDASHAAHWSSRAARARFVSERLLDAARAGGPTSDEEVAVLSEQHWRDVDRPEAVRVIHALVKHAGDGKAAEARSLADRLRIAVENASDADDFRARALAVDRGTFDVVVQPLPAFAADGRVTEGPGDMVLDFARAASAMAKVGDTSPVVETTFGYHVIRLLDRLGPQRMSLEERRLAFYDEALRRRASSMLDKILGERKSRTPIEIASSAEAAMRNLMAQANPR